MKTQGRAKSRNVVDRSNSTMGRIHQFVNESLKYGSSNHKPSTPIGKRGTRKGSTGRLTGGGF